MAENEDSHTLQTLKAVSEWTDEYVMKIVKDPACATIEQKRQYLSNLFSSPSGKQYVESLHLTKRQQKKTALTSQ